MRDDEHSATIFGLREHKDLDLLMFITACCHGASQLDLVFPRRDEEMLPQRLGAEGALSVHQLAPDYGCTHHSSQCKAQVRS